MSLETIDRTWRPSKKTSETLKSPKYGYTQEQVNDLGRQFIQRFLNKQVQGASHKFFEFVRTSGVGKNMPKPDRTADKQQEEQRKANFANKSEDSAEKAKEVKQQAKKTTQEQQSEDLNKLLINPSIADLRQYHQLGGACTKEFAMHWNNHQRNLPINHGFD